LRQFKTADLSWLPLLMLCALSFNFRSILLAVAPALPQIRNEFQLNFAAAGALTALPVVVMGGAAIPGAALVDRFGARKVLGIGGLGLAACSALRLAPPQLLNLYVWTAAFAACIAVSQPALAVVARSWFPHNVQRATTAYSTALNLGAVAGASLSVYLIASFGWRSTFFVWSSVAFAAAAGWLWLSPAVPAPAGGVQTVRSALKDSVLWRVALILGFQSIIYYGSSTWVPFELRGEDHAYVSLVLLLLTGSTIPVGILLTTIKRPWARSPLLYLTAGSLAVIGSVGLLASPHAWAWVWALVLGSALGMGFSGGMSMPSMIAPSNAHVASYSALALTVAYAMAFLGPLAGGLLVDRTGLFQAPFWLTTGAGIGLASVGATLPRRPMHPDMGIATASSPQRHLDG
jgi:MFS transporter, CP family, cyanate transporter